MDGFYLALILVMSLALVYLLLHLRLSHTIEAKFREIYKNQLQQDIQEFYREMESYAALVESRLQRYKALVERHENIINRWQEISFELKKNKKTKEIGDWIERSLAKEQQMMETLAKISHALSHHPQGLIENQEIKRQTKETKKETKETTKEGKKTTSKKTTPTTPKVTKENHPPTLEGGEVNFASQVLESYEKEAKPPLTNTLLANEKAKDLTPVSKPWGFKPTLGKFAEVMFRLVTNKPLEPEKTSFAQIIAPSPTAQVEPVAPLAKEQVNYQALRELKPSPLVKKIDPEELQALVEKMRQQPAMRPALLKILVQHNIPLAMVADLTGIELSQLEAIRKLYNF